MSVLQSVVINLSLEKKGWEEPSPHSLLFFLLLLFFKVNVSWLSLKALELI